jgi:hypothetical protein
MSARVVFKQPPITEVVFSAGFRLERPLATAYIGRYWERIKDNFPQTQDAAPLPSIATPHFVEGVPQLQVQFAMSDLPPVRRVWFVSPEGRDLIQIQDDRFVFNWRRNEADVAYPGYDNVFARFEEQLEGFVKFLSDEELGSPAYTLLELTYVNQMNNMNGLTHVGFTSAQVDHRRDGGRERFLPMPLATNSGDVYALPGQAGSLQIQFQGAPSGARLDITARGAPRSSGLDGLRAWFAVAHEWAVRGFVDVTATEFHEEHWGREP